MLKSKRARATASPFKSADAAARHGMTQEQVMHDVLLAKHPSKSFVLPEDMAAMALFLCGAAARNITGTNYSIDGGWAPE